MKILYATDFSVPAFTARKVVASLARRLGDSVVVVHVLQVPSVFSPEMMAAEPAILDGMKISAAEQTRVVAEGLRREGIQVEEQVLIGGPSEAVSRLAEEMDARLVVVGTHGRTAVGRLFVGSVAERLVRLCKRPVLVVPPGAELRLIGPARTGSLRLTVVLDRGPAGDAAVALAGQIRTSTPADVAFVHLYDSEQEHARLGLPIPFAATDPDPDILTLLDRDLRPRTEHLPGQGRVDLRLCAIRGSAAEFLDWTAVAQHADLVIVGAASGRGGRLERAAALDVVRAATVPVLVAPAPARGSPTSGRGIPPVRSVLAATDLSAAGNTAVTEAYRLLRASGGVLELCHVAAAEPLSPERWAELQEQLWAMVPAQADAHGIATRVSVLQGDTPAEALLQASERLGTDVLVVGSHGRSALARAVLGSVADTLVRRSTKPVLIVRGRGASA